MDSFPPRQLAHIPPASPAWQGQCTTEQAGPGPRMPTPSAPVGNSKLEMQPSVFAPPRVARNEGDAAASHGAGIDLLLMASLAVPGQRPGFADAPHAAHAAPAAAAAGPARKLRKVIKAGEPRSAPSPELALAKHFDDCDAKAFLKRISAYLKWHRANPRDVCQLYREAFSTLTLWSIFDKKSGYFRPTDEHLALAKAFGGKLATLAVSFRAHFFAPKLVSSMLDEQPTLLAAIACGMGKHYQVLPDWAADRNKRRCDAPTIQELLRALDKWPHREPDWLRADLAALLSSDRDSKLPMSPAVSILLAAGSKEPDIPSAEALRDKFIDPQDSSFCHTIEMCQEGLGGTSLAWRRNVISAYQGALNLISNEKELVNHLQRGKEFGKALGEVTTSCASRLFSRAWVTELQKTRIELLASVVIGIGRERYAAICSAADGYAPPVASLRKLLDKDHADMHRELLAMDPDAGPAEFVQPDVEAALKDALAAEEAARKAYENSKVKRLELEALCNLARNAKATKK